MSLNEFPAINRRKMSETMHERSRKTLRFFAFQSGSLTLLITTFSIWPLLGKSLSLDLFGQLVLAISISSILSPVLSLGLGISLSYFGREQNQAARKGLVQLASVWVSGLALLALGFFGASFFQFGSSFLYWVTILTISGSIVLITSGALRVLDNPTPFFVVTLISALLGLSVLLTAPDLVGKSDSIFVGFAASSIFALIATYSFKALPIPKIHETNLGWSTALSGSLLLGLHQLMAVSLLLGVRVIVGVASGSTALASFIFCALLVGGGLTVGSTLDGYWSIESQRAKTLAQLKIYLQNVQSKIQWILFGLAVIVSVFWATLRDVWLPPGVDVEQIGMAIGFGLPAWGLQAFSDSSSAYLLWQKRRFIVSISTTISVVITFSLCLLLVPLLGIASATLALTLGMLTRSLCLMVFDSKETLHHLKSSYIAYLLTIGISLIFLIA
jgi:O-antigen/teichoic acid export membrane protein